MGSDSGTAGGGNEKSAKAKGPSVFDNFAEDLDSILDGTADSRHSAYDDRNAAAMAKKTGRDKQDYLPGGHYGPGGKGYSPIALHESGQGRLAATRSGDRDTASPKSERRTRLRTLGPRTQAGTLHRLGDAVGPLGRNAPEDVTRVQGMLVAKGRLDPDAVTGYPGTKMVEATKAFQQEAGLTVDGQINPGGPTERALTAPERPRPATTVLSGSALPDAVRGAGTALDQQLSAAKAAMAQGGATKGEQVRNIERFRGLKDKHAAAQDKAITKANEAAAKNRARVKSYLDIMGDDKARHIGLTADAVRKTAWKMAKREVETGVSATGSIGRGIHITDVAPTAPQTEPGFVRYAVGVNGINNFNDVLEVQQTLAAKGYMDDQYITGYIGTKMVDGIKSMQKAEGLSVTGTIQPGDAAPGDNPNAEGDAEGFVRTAADAVLLGGGGVIAGLVGAGYGLGRQLLEGDVDQAWDTATGMYDAMAEDHGLRLQQFAANNPKTTMALRAAGAVPAAAGGVKGGVQLTHGAARAAAPTVGRSVTGTRNLLDDGVSRTIEFSGREYLIGDKLRVAPLGNRTGHRYGKWPHYHRGVPDPKKPGHSIEGQGVNRHRPWEPKSSDKSLKDRF